MGGLKGIQDAWSELVWRVPCAVCEHGDSGNEIRQRLPPGIVTIKKFFWSSGGELEAIPVVSNRIEKHIPSSRREFIVKTRANFSPVLGFSRYPSYHDEMTNILHYSCWDPLHFLDELY